MSCFSLASVDASGPCVIVSSFNMSRVNVAHWYQWLRVLSVVYCCTHGSVCMVRVNIIHAGPAVVVVVGSSL